MKELSLCDPWRIQNLSKREYSSTFNTYSRIDYSLISTSLLVSIQSCVHDSIVLSDHSPTSLFFINSQLRKGSSRWSLHPKWLHDLDLIKFVGENIDIYFEINKDQTSAATQWEAFKVYIRGQMISLTSSKCNKFKQKMNEWIQKLENYKRWQAVIMQYK